MKCTKCGYENKENVKFCFQCGAKIKTRPNYWWLIGVFCFILFVVAMNYVVNRKWENKGHLVEVHAENGTRIVDDNSLISILRIIDERIGEESIRYQFINSKNYSERYYNQNVSVYIYGEYVGDAVIQEDDNDSIYIIVKLNKNEDNEYEIDIEKYITDARKCVSENLKRLNIDEEGTRAEALIITDGNTSADSTDDTITISEENIYK